MRIHISQGKAIDAGHPAETADLQEFLKPVRLMASNFRARPQNHTQNRLPRGSRTMADIPVRTKRHETDLHVRIVSDEIR